MLCIYHVNSLASCDGLGHCRLTSWRFTLLQPRHLHFRGLRLRLGLFSRGSDNWTISFHHISAEAAMDHSNVFEDHRNHLDRGLCHPFFVALSHSETFYWIRIYGIKYYIKRLKSVLFKFLTCNCVKRFVLAIGLSVGCTLFTFLVR